MAHKTTLQHQGQLSIDHVDNGRLFRPRNIGSAVLRQDGVQEMVHGLIARVLNIVVPASANDVRTHGNNNMMVVVHRWSCAIHGTMPVVVSWCVKNKK